MLLAGTSAYIGSMSLIHKPTPGQFFTPTNNHPAFTSADQFLGMVGGVNIADQRKITCRHQLLVLCTCSCRGKPSRIFWNNVRIHSQSYIKMYKWSVHYVPQILLNFLQNCYQAKIQIKFYSFYIVDLLFTWLDCMSWPKWMADAWKNHQ